MRLLTWSQACLHVGAACAPTVARLEAVVEQDVGGLHVSVQRARLARRGRVQVDQRARRVTQDAQPVPPRQRRRLDRVAESLRCMHSRRITRGIARGITRCIQSSVPHIEPMCHAHVQKQAVSLEERGHTQRYRCFCGASAVHLRRICDASAAHLRCICGASAVHLRCICGGWAPAGAAMPRARAARGPRGCHPSSEGRRGRSARSKGGGSGEGGACGGLEGDEGMGGCAGCGSP